MYVCMYVLSMWKVEMERVQDGMGEWKDEWTAGWLRGGVTLLEDIWSGWKLSTVD